MKEEFREMSVSRETHELLTGIHHFRTIITTNSDDLFEYTDPKIEVIRTNTDCANANPKDKMLFKIHGDFTDTNHMILTNKDYCRFFLGLSG